MRASGWVWPINLGNRVVCAVEGTLQRLDEHPMPGTARITKICVEPEGLDSIGGSTHRVVRKIHNLDLWVTHSRVVDTTCNRPQWSHETPPMAAFLS